jgi:AsmA-like C-terminal region
MKLTEYISGDVPIVATIAEDQDSKTEVSIAADLSKVKMKLAALGWKRDAIANTKASFKVVSGPDGSRKIQDFVLDGDGLHLNGSINVGPSGKMTSITMDEISLDEDNAFSAKVVAGEAGNDFSISGKNFDARPYIQNVMSPSKKASDTSTSANSQDFSLNAHFDHITANRGEAIDDVTAIIRVRGGRIAAANIQGRFLSGQPVTLNVTPLPNGRDVRVKTTDAGAAIRAANFYSKIAGGDLVFSALVGNEPGSPLRNGQVQIHNFEVRNEAALAELDKRGTPRKSGPRAGGLTFSQLAMPFTIDEEFIRIGDTVLRGTDMCATASGLIRKSDSRMDITGTVIPVCGVSGVFNNVPIVGELLAGGNNNEGLFGMTFALGGVMSKPNMQFNPLSVLAPGIFRRFFDFKQGTPKNKVPIGTKSEN